ncbi:MAG TPA: NB-ARC domain-containing protein, partial [Anaerolineales bacterium]|nr:NB-ARC domain-containing protein [Anaerolineales bacterium]
MSKRLEVRLLGKFEINYDGKSIAITSRPAQSLFAYLILSAGTSHRREKLAGMLWPDSLEETARDNLRHTLWRMRKVLESASSIHLIQADDVSIGFKESSDYWLDAAELEKLGENASADELIAVLSEYQGELLPGFYDEWVGLEREHLYSIFEHHMARLLALLEEEQRWLDLLEWAERWIKLGQKPEPAYRALMSAHAAKGDMSKVAATYERCVKSLKEFGVEPSEQTRALYERLKAGKENFQTRSAAPTKEQRGQPPKTNVPVPLTSFIGRKRELEEVKLLLSSARLLTLTGVGGIGKTRLAIQAAHELIRSFKDGVWWVELAPLADEALVPQALAQVLSVRESPGQSLAESLKSFLREKQALLILDNCEHLVVTCAQLAEGLLSQCTNLRIMTTSREALGITGEATLQVPALSSPVLTNLPPMQAWNEFESIQLFLERAEVAHPGLRLTQQNAFAVPQICQRLDGIPLAIELAAARVKLLSLEEIAIHLDDRFAFLTRGSRTALPRHQTLQAAIDWSYDLL